MKKLNNKGMTLIEVVICFTLTGIIAVAMLNAILNYKTRQDIEATNADVIRYKNNITQIIQSDIIKNHLESVGDDADVNKTKVTTENNYKKYSLKLNFTKPFKNDVKTKTLNIYQSTGAESQIDYIEYPDKNNQIVKYSLSDYGSDKVDIDGVSENLMHLRFGSINIDEEAIRLGFLSIDIPIYHHELGNKNHILIKAPINQ